MEGRVRKVVFKFKVLRAYFEVIVMCVMCSFELFYFIYIIVCDIGMVVVSLWVRRLVFGKMSDLLNLYNWGIVLLEFVFLFFYFKLVNFLLKIYLVKV